MAVFGGACAPHELFLLAVGLVKNGNPKIGETNTNAPHVCKDKVITGISDGEFGVGGH